MNSRTSLLLSILLSRPARHLARAKRSSPADPNPTIFNFWNEHHTTVLLKRKRCDSSTSVHLAFSIDEPHFSFFFPFSISASFGSPSVASTLLSSFFSSLDAERRCDA